MSGVSSMIVSSDDSTSNKSCSPGQKGTESPLDTPGDVKTIVADTTPTPEICSVASSADPTAVTRPMESGIKLRTNPTKITSPTPVKLREKRNNNNNHNTNDNNNHRASYPAAILPTVTENRSLDNRKLMTASCDDSRRASGNWGSVSGSSSTDRLSGTDGN